MNNVIELHRKRLRRRPALCPHRFSLFIVDLLDLKEVLALTYAHEEFSNSFLGKKKCCCKGIRANLVQLFALGAPADGGFFLAIKKKVSVFMGVGEKLALLAVIRIHQNGESIFVIRQEQSRDAVVEWQSAHPDTLSFDDFRQIR